MDHIKFSRRMPAADVQALGKIRKADRKPNAQLVFEMMRDFLIDPAGRPDMEADTFYAIGEQGVYSSAIVAALEERVGGIEADAIAAFDQDHRSIDDLTQTQRAEAIVKVKGELNAQITDTVSLLKENAEVDGQVGIVVAELAQLRSEERNPKDRWENSTRDAGTRRIKHLEYRLHRVQIDVLTEFIELVKAARNEAGKMDGPQQTIAVKVNAELVEDFTDACEEEGRDVRYTLATLIRERVAEIDKKAKPQKRDWSGAEWAPSTTLRDANRALRKVSTPADIIGTSEAEAPAKAAKPTAPNAASTAA